ncbi:MAG: ABC transporter substrate binding protein, partial [Desulfobacteraceae bacterium]|nr:ABC transporter substrate binding protein [Desulfobacteraceae bacterium]
MILWMIGWGVLFPAHCLGVEEKAESYQIVLFVSKNIRPYVEAVDGLRDQLARSIEANVEIIMMERYDETAIADLAERFSGESELDLVASIGPEAASFVWETFQNAAFPKIYSIILNPEKVVNDIETATGISLNIPPADQLNAIRQGLSSVHRIGIFYDPLYNNDFYAQAAEAAFGIDVDLVPIKVSSRKDIPFLLEECWDSIDCVWLIPDRTVISESIAQYIIKQAVLKKVPVVGYNQFFYDSGAAMAFVFDYKDLGRQSAKLLTDVLQQKEFESRVPVFNVWLNETVFEKLDIPP